MEEQTLQSEVRSTSEEALSWQYILVLVVIAALIPLLAGSFISNVDRAERPPMPTAAPEPLSAEALQALAEIPLTQTYEDPSGITIQYPESWHILSLSDGFFVVSNYELDLTTTEFPEDIVIMQVQKGQLSAFAMPDGSVPDPGTSPQAILETLVADSPDSIEVTPRAIDELPAASIAIIGQGSARELFLVAPTETDLVLVDSSTEEGMWQAVEPLVGRITESMTFAPASE
ncbi:MAG: hypothetical protein JXN59_05985 [Anaerolineae bacterium]|nr:hypothetical protein [Anaerolineae bacterium]